MTLVPANHELSPVRPWTVTPTLTATALTAATHKFAWIGQYTSKAKTTKSIRKISFLPGTIVSAGGSTARLSLQDVDAATGLPARPDGTQDQTADFLISTATSGTMFKSGNLSADRTVADGALIAVVLEFQTYLGADSVAVQNLALSSSNFLNIAECVNYAGASWAATTVLANIAFENSDGTIGWLEGGFICDALVAPNFNSSSTPDEIALAFTVPYPCKADAGWFLWGPGGAARDFSLILYNGTTALTTTAVDGDQLPASAGKPHRTRFAEQQFAIGTQYYWSVRPDTTNSGTGYSFTVSDILHMDSHNSGGGEVLNWASRVDGGLWTIITTKKPFAGLHISAVDDGTAGAGGGGTRGMIG